MIHVGWGREKQSMKGGAGLCVRVCVCFAYSAHLPAGKIVMSLLKTLLVFPILHHFYIYQYIYLAFSLSLSFFVDKY